MLRAKTFGRFFLLAGLARDFDSDFFQASSLPGTCTGKRRIDWAMGSRLWASAIRHRRGIANHPLVEYDMDVASCAGEKIAVAFNVLDVLDATAIQHLFEEPWDDCGFLQALSTHVGYAFRYSRNGPPF